MLTPDPETTQIFSYCTAWAADKTGVDIHGMGVMGNHHHTELTDHQGRLPEFMREMNKYISKCMNAKLGRSENFWSAEEPSVVELTDDKDVFNKLVYTLCNPVSSWLVPHSRQWPGLLTRPEDWLKEPRVIKRPAFHFRKNGKAPEQVELKLVRPEIYTDLDDAQLAERVAQAMETREAELRAEARRKGRRFLGLKRVRAQSPFSRPRSRRTRGGLKPRVAGLCKWRRLQALRRRRDFIEGYRAAYARWRQGDRDVVFPAGTYALRVHAGVACYPPG
jgi:hypothetical protein